MSDNAEVGIARVQLSAAKSQGGQQDMMRKHHQRSVANLDDRIISMVMGLFLLGLIGVWATAESPLVIYGSFAAVILLTIGWGYLRYKRIQKVKQQRDEEARSWKSNDSGQD